MSGRNTRHRPTLSELPLEVSPATLTYRHTAQPFDVLVLWQVVTQRLVTVNKPNLVSAVTGVPLV